MKGRYAKGARLERRTMTLLESAGYFCVRSAGSHSPVDVVAIKSEEPLRLIQVKANRNASPAERDELRAVPRFVDGAARIVAEVWIWHDGNPVQPEIVEVKR